jgi:hypothetical protein
MRMIKPIRLYHLLKKGINNMTINNEDIYDAVRESRVDINVCLERLDKLEKLIQELSSQAKKDKTSILNN